MEEDFWAVLSGAAGVAVLVPAARIVWGALPQDAPYPAIVLNVISGKPSLTYAGPDRLRRHRVQVDCYATNSPGVVVLARAVETALNGFRGQNFLGIFLEDSRASREPEPTGGPFRISIDFITQWRAP